MNPLTKSKKGYKLDLYENKIMNKDIEEMLLEILHNLIWIISIAIFVVVIAIFYYLFAQLIIN